MKLEFARFRLWWIHKNVFYEHTEVRLRLSLMDVFSRKNILIKEVPRVHQGDVTISTKVSHAFSWSYSPSEYLRYYVCMFH